MLGSRSTWEFDAKTWTWRDSTPSTGQPAVLVTAALTYDPVARRGLLVEGSATFTWDGSAWTRRSVPVTPPSRERHAMALDANGRVVLFGGRKKQIGGTELYADTWVWDGQAWTERFPSVSPSGHWFHHMTFDPSNGRVMLFGGTGDDEVWEWDGLTWRGQVPTGPKPSSASVVALLTDELRRRVLLLERRGAPGAETAAVWEWRGASGQWRQLSNHAVPRSISWSASVYDWGGAVYDSVADRIILLTDAGVWSLGPAAAYATPFGAGCPGSRGRPALSASSPPVLGDQGFALTLGPVAPWAPVLVGVSSSASPVTLPRSCRFYLPSSVVWATAVSGAATATLALPIPNAPAFLGAELYAQGLVLDPNGALFGGIALSDALHLGLGR